MGDRRELVVVPPHRSLQFALGLKVHAQVASAKAAGGWAWLGVGGTRVTKPLGHGSSIAMVLWLRVGRQRKGQGKMQPHSGGRCVVGSGSSGHAAWLYLLIFCVWPHCHPDLYAQMSHEAAQHGWAGRLVPPDEMSCCLFTA